MIAVCCAENLGRRKVSRDLLRTGSRLSADEYRLGAFCRRIAILIAFSRPYLSELRLEKRAAMPSPETGGKVCASKKILSTKRRTKSVFVGKIRRALNCDLSFQQSVLARLKHSPFRLNVRS